MKKVHNFLSSSQNRDFQLYIVYFNVRILHLILLQQTYKKKDFISILRIFCKNSCNDGKLGKQLMKKVHSNCPLHFLASFMTSPRGIAIYLLTSHTVGMTSQVKCTMVEIFQKARHKSSYNLNPFQTHFKSKSTALQFISQS